MDFLLELVFDLLLEGIGEAAIEKAFGGLARLMRRWFWRNAILGAIGFVAGFGWGSVHSDLASVPRTFGTSLVIAGAMLLLMGWRIGRTDSDERVLAWPWRWPHQRLLGFAILSTLVAAGVWLGYA